MTSFLRIKFLRNKKLFVNFSIHVAKLNYYFFLNFYYMNFKNNF